MNRNEIYPVRPGAVLTAGFGHDVDPVLHVYRFHRAIDRAGGDGLVYNPCAAARAIIEDPSSPTLGTLIRLISANGFEIRIAHCENFTPDFVALVKAGRPIPAGMVIASEGDVGKATGPHSHIELVAVGGRNTSLDALLSAQGIQLGKYWSPKALTAKNKAWMKEFSCTKLGPHECVAWDRRTRGTSIWMDPHLVLGL